MSLDNIHLDWSVGIPSLISAVVTCVVFIITVVKWKTLNDVHVEKIGEIEKKIAIIDTRVEDQKTHLTENYVKKGDLDKLESRIERMFTSLNENLTGQIKDIEHHMRNLDSKIYQLATGTTRNRDRDRE